MIKTIVGWFKKKPAKPALEVNPEIADDEPGDDTKVLMTIMERGKEVRKKLDDCTVKLDERLKESAKDKKPTGMPLADAQP